MDISALTIHPRQLREGEAAWSGPLCFVDLDSASAAPEALHMPPCPVIGLGDPAHPLAAMLDAVVEAPITAEPLAKQVLARPHAAAVVTQLLRMLPAMPCDQGLIAESLAYGLLQGSAEHGDWLAGRGPSPVRSEGAVHLERSDDCLTITLHHPASGNAIDRVMRDALHEALSLAALDPQVRRVSLRGAGRTFSLGAELGEFGTTRDPAAAHAIRMATLPAHMAARVANKLDAYVQGGCVGAGLELAAWASHITAAPDAWFQLPELAMGILPGAGGCVSLTRRIGRQRAALLILSGKRISAKQALGWGLIDAISSDKSGANQG